MQVLEKRGDWLVGGQGQTPMTRLEIGMAVPGNGFTVVNLNKAHASFDQSARNESLPTMHGIAIGLSNVDWLAADIEGVYRFELHAGGQFVGLNARFEP